MSPIVASTIRYDVGATARNMPTRVTRTGRASSIMALPNLEIGRLRASGLLGCHEPNPQAVSALRLLSLTRPFAHEDRPTSDGQARVFVCAARDTAEGARHLSSQVIEI
jgi:hypothetical protein